MDSSAPIKMTECAGPDSVSEPSAKRLRASDDTSEIKEAEKTQRVDHTARIATVLRVQVLLCLPYADVCKVARAGKAWNAAKKSAGYRPTWINFPTYSHLRAPETLSLAPASVSGGLWDLLHLEETRQLTWQPTRVVLRPEPDEKRLAVFDIGDDYKGPSKQMQYLPRLFQHATELWMVSLNITDNAQALLAAIDAPVRDLVVTGRVLHHVYWKLRRMGRLGNMQQRGACMQGVTRLTISQPILALEGGDRTITDARQLLTGEPLGGDLLPHVDPDAFGRCVLKPARRILERLTLVSPSASRHQLRMTLPLMNALAARRVDLLLSRLDVEQPIPFRDTLEDLSYGDYHVRRHLKDLRVCGGLDWLPQLFIEHCGDAPSDVLANVEVLHLSEPLICCLETARFATAFSNLPALRELHLYGVTCASQLLPAVQSSLPKASAGSSRRLVVHAYALPAHAEQPFPGVVKTDQPLRQPHIVWADVRKAVAAAMAVVPKQLQSLAKARMVTGVWHPAKEGGRDLDGRLYPLPVTSTPYAALADILTA